MELADKEAYSWDCPNGTWRGRLIFKEWNNKGASHLVLYFEDVTTGAKCRLSSFWTDNYKAKSGQGPNFREMPLGSVVELATEKTEKGFTKLVSARLA